jgi:tetratricopeptide (TPR) repeat protein
VALLSGALAIAMSQYRNLPLVYINAILCNHQSQQVAGPACGRIVDSAQVPAKMRMNALRRLAAIGSGVGDEEYAVKQLTTLIQSGMAVAEDWNLRGSSNFALRNYSNAAEDFETAAQMIPTNGIYWKNLGDVQIQMKEFSAANQSYTNAISNGYNTAEVLSNRSWVRNQLGLPAQ